MRTWLSASCRSNEEILTIQAGMESIGYRVYYKDPRCAEPLPLPPLAPDEGIQPSLVAIHNAHTPRTTPKRNSLVQGAPVTKSAGESRSSNVSGRPSSTAVDCTSMPSSQSTAGSSKGKERVQSNVDDEESDVEDDVGPFTKKPGDEETEFQVVVYNRVRAR